MAAAGHASVPPLQATIVRDVAASEEVGRRLLQEQTFDFLCHIHNTAQGTTTQLRRTLELLLPPPVLEAAEGVLGALPPQDAGGPASKVGSEPFVGDAIAGHLQAWFRPQIIYYDGRLATKYDRGSDSDIAVPGAVVSVVGGFALPSGGGAAVDCLAVHSVKSKDMTARKAFNPNSEDGRALLGMLQAQLKGRRGRVVLKLLALSLPLTSHHAERPFRLLWTLPYTGGRFVQVATPPFTVAKRTPSRGEGVIAFTPSRVKFPALGSQSLDSLLEAVAVPGDGQLPPPPLLQPPGAYAGVAHSAPPGWSGPGPVPLAALPIPGGGLPMASSGLAGAAYPPQRRGLKRSAAVEPTSLAAQLGVAPVPKVPAAMPARAPYAGLAWASAPVIGASVSGSGSDAAPLPAVPAVGVASDTGLSIPGFVMGSDSGHGAMGWAASAPTRGRPAPGVPLTMPAAGARALGLPPQ